jgi:hypothetical protein
MTLLYIQPALPAQRKEPSQRLSFIAIQANGVKISTFKIHHFIWENELR